MVILPRFLHTRVRGLPVINDLANKIIWHIIPVVGVYIGCKSTEIGHSIREHLFLLQLSQFVAASLPITFEDAVDAARFIRYVLADFTHVIWQQLVDVLLNKCRQ